MILNFKYLFYFILLILYQGINVASIAKQSPLILKNEFIKIIVNENNNNIGRFAIETTQGDPKNKKDDQVPLVFGRPLPWTSFSTLSIDNQVYIFGGHNPKYQKRSQQKIRFGTIISQKKTKNEIVTVCDFNKIRVTQRLSLFRHPNTKVFDSALIQYDVTNHDLSSHHIGLRIMLDTMLGANDAAPFRFGNSAITSETQFLKKDFFTYWQTFDDLSQPSIIAQGTLLAPNHNLTPPDKLILANWGQLVANPWDAEYKKNRSFTRKGELEQDTAMALYWLNTRIKPGETRRFKTIYGLGGVQLTPGELTLGLSSPKLINIMQKDAFLIMVYVLNAGGYDAKDTQLQLKLPAGFKLISGDLNHRLGTLPSRAIRQFPIMVAIDPLKAKAGTQIIQVKASSSTLEDNHLKESISLIAPKALQATLNIDPQVFRREGLTFVKSRLRVSNPGKLPIYNIQSQIVFSSSNYTLPIFEIPSKTFSLASKESIDIEWLLTLDPSAQNQAAITIDLNDGFTQQQISATSKILATHADYAFKLSTDQLSSQDYFYLEIGIPTSLLDQNPQLEIDYPQELLQFLRQNVPSILKDKSEERYFKQEESRLVFNLKPFKKIQNRLIFRLHFKAQLKGRSSFRIFNHGHLIKSLPIFIDHVL
eukprot:COSAG01_NODE_519_length_16012_cov_4.344058_4_plen_648_part_00